MDGNLSGIRLLAEYSSNKGLPHVEQVVKRYLARRLAIGVVCNDVYTSLSAVFESFKSMILRNAIDK